MVCTSCVLPDLPVCMLVLVVLCLVLRFGAAGYVWCFLCKFGWVLLFAWFWWFACALMF